MISSNNKNEDMPRIKSAIKWSFDSSMDELENPPLSLLQMCIGLEALLGDFDYSEGLTSTLSDRYAYLLGVGITERKKIKEKFKDLYKTRSSLVHGSLLELKDRDQDLLHWGRSILDRALLTELLPWLDGNVTHH